MRFVENVGQDEPQSVTGIASQDFPVVISPFLQTIIKARRGAIILDADDKRFKAERATLPWPEATRSVVTVVLREPREVPDPSGAQDDVYALVTVASAMPGDLNETDRDVLVQFAETLTLAMQNLAAQGERAQFLSEFSHTVTAALNPLDISAQALRATLKMIKAPDALPTLAQIAAPLQDTTDRMDLLRKLTTWFFTLVADDPDAVVDETETTHPTLEMLISQMYTPMATLAKTYRREAAVVWPAQTPPGIVLRGRATYIQAALFEFIRNALKYSAQNPQVEIDVAKSDVFFRVLSHGQQVPRDERGLIFASRFRASNVGSATGSGIGLYQVSQIAQKLGGHVNYETPEGTDLNVFVFAVPHA